VWGERWDKSRCGTKARSLLIRPYATRRWGCTALRVLLEAVTVCITQILNADSLRQALTDALQTIGRVVQIDRMVVIETIPTGTAELTPGFVFVWNAEDAPKVDVEAIITASPDRSVIEEWLSPLRTRNARQNQG